MVATEARFRWLNRCRFLSVNTALHALGRQ